MLVEKEMMIRLDDAALQHPAFARLYTRISGILDRHGAAEHRVRLLAGLRGLVLEVSVPNPARALTEISRVLRRGGELRFYEHVRSSRTSVGLIQDVITPLWSRAAAGCHPNRRTVAAIGAAGFVVDDLDQIPFGLPHVIGRAHLPSSAR